uniref:RING-type E3 ubiquitin transferase n=1 Tax=Acrobeloides nanus TaxID=290746 RepID=A0A914C2C9_9BILA
MVFSSLLKHVSDDTIATNWEELYRQLHLCQYSQSLGTITSESLTLLSIRSFSIGFSHKFVKALINSLSSEEEMVRASTCKLWLAKITSYKELFPLLLSIHSSLTVTINNVNIESAISIRFMNEDDDNWHTVDHVLYAWSMLFNHLCKYHDYEVGANDFIDFNKEWKHFLLANCSVDDANLRSLIVTQFPKVFDELKMKYDWLIEESTNMKNIYLLMQKH